MTDLEKRVESFSKMASSFEHNKVHDLIVVSDVADSDIERLETIVKMYMSKCLGLDTFISDEYELLYRFNKEYNSIKNITPNGLVVPKNNTILEYNLLSQCFYNIIRKLKIDEYVTSWHIPLNLRVKLSEPIAENMVRPYNTEAIHSDSFAGESSESVTIMLPIFGDTDNNCLEFYTPPDNFKEEWLGPKESYAAGNVVAEQYDKVDFTGKKRTLIILDFSTLHNSHRKPGCGMRVSIDTTFALKRNKSVEVIHPWREDERATVEVVNNLGKDFLFVFPDDVDQHVSNEGGHKHPTNLNLVELNK